MRFQIDSDPFTTATISKVAAFSFFSFTLRPCASEPVQNLMSE
jgi:hypothetical protein